MVFPLLGLKEHKELTTMKKFTWGLLLLAMTQLAYGDNPISTGKPGVPLPSDVESRLNFSATHAPLVKLGTQVTQKKLNVLKAVYDVSKLGGATLSTFTLRDAAGGQAVLPKGAIVQRVLIHTPLALTTGSTMTWLSLGVNTPRDLQWDIPYTAYALNAVMEGRVAGTSTSIRVAAANSAVVGKLVGGSLSAGKVNFFIEYVLSE